ncbi:ferredoxin [Thermococcus barossii]|uniref:ferredoxin n=1 Tax=Thermococcus barossii TaxID=54077 RepID=UPI0037434BC3
MIPVAKWRVWIDEEYCVGDAVCVSFCPEVFELDEETGKARTKVDIIGEDLYDCVKEALEACTAACIYMEQIE